MFCGEQKVHISNKHSKGVYDYLKHIAACLLIIVDIVKLADNTVSLPNTSHVPPHPYRVTADLLLQCE